MQGFNMGRYTKPSTLDPALGPPTKSSRLSKSQSGPKAAPVVRFEMPFAIWCGTCPASSSDAIIGQGVRFNAQKRKVGNFYSTPIWAFRVKHTACGGWIEIRTNPAAHDFDVVEGATRRDYGDDATVALRTDAVVVGLDEDEAERRRQDAFVAFEGKAAEKTVIKNEARRLEELRSRQERDWKDPDRANRRLRDAFRVGRKARERDARESEALQDKFGLAIDIAPASEEDVVRASLQSFGPSEVLEKAVFESKALSGGGKKVSKQAFRLGTTLHNNTRVNMDAFGTGNGLKNGLQSIPGVKRKRKTQDPGMENTSVMDDSAQVDSSSKTSHKSALTSGLVAYDSETD